MLSDLTLPATAAESLGLAVADAKVTRLISVASDAIRGALNRPQVHYAAAYVERLAGHLEQVRLRLGLRPILSVASVVLPDGSSLSATEYTREDDEAGVLYRASGWPYTGLVRSGLLYDAKAVGTELKSIVVTYEGGWVTPAQAAFGGWSGPARSLPYDIEEACLRLTTNLYRSAGDAENVTQESLGSYSVTYADRARVGVLTPSVQELLRPYARPFA